MAQLEEFYTSREEVTKVLDDYNQGKAKEDRKYYIYQKDYFLKKDVYLVVDYEMFSMYQNLEREERRERDNESRCILPSAKYGYKRCIENCDECPFGKTKRDGRHLSTDYTYANDNGEEYQNEIEDESSSVDEEIEKREKEKFLNQLLDKLNEKDRSILDYYNDDLSDSEIAHNLHMNRRTVADKRMKLIMRLQKEVEKYFK